MTTPNPFLALPYPELLAVQRMCQATKFGQVYDSEIHQSPHINTIYRQVIAALLAHDYDQRGITKVKDWLTWLTIDNTRDEWKFVVAQLAADEVFDHISDYAKDLVIRESMSPFKLTVDQVQAMIAEINETK